MAEKYGRKVKEKMVQETKDVLSGDKGFILSTVENMKASDMDVLRKSMKKMGSRYMVLKNRLADIALEETEVEGIGDLALEKKIIGVGVINDDVVETVKVMKEFSKKKKGFNIKMGYVEGRAITAERVDELADLPGREQLLAMVLGTMNAPVTSFVSAMSGIMKKLLYALNAVKEKKGSE